MMFNRPTRTCLDVRGDFVDDRREREARRAPIRPEVDEVRFRRSADLALPRRVGQRHDDLVAHRSTPELCRGVALISCMDALGQRQACEILVGEPNLRLDVETLLHEVLNLSGVLGGVPDGRSRTSWSVRYPSSSRAPVERIVVTKLVPPAVEQVADLARPLEEFLSRTGLTDRTGGAPALSNVSVSYASMNRRMIVPMCANRHRIVRSRPVSGTRNLRREVDG